MLTGPVTNMAKHKKDATANFAGEKGAIRFCEVGEVL